MNQSFLLIQRAFLCCQKLKNNDLQIILKDITWDQQEILIANTISTDINEKYPIKINYQIEFLKSIIQILEEQNNEVHDQIYEAICRLKCSQEVNDGFSYKHYSIPSQDNENKIIATLKESNSIITQGTTGLCTWQAGVALADWALQNKPIFKNKIIIELGSGIGLTGFIISKLCDVKHIIQTDGNDKVLELLTENSILNNLESKLNHEIKLLDWNSPEEFKINGSTPDIVLAADVVYDKTIFKPLIHTIRHFLLKEESLMYLACTERNPETLHEFIQLLKEVFRVTEHCQITQLFLQWDQSTPIRLYRIEKH